MHRCTHVIKEISHWNTYITLVRLFQWLKKINDSYDKDLKDRSIKIVLWLRKITGGWSIVSDVKWDQTVSFKFSTLNWINKLSKDMVQVGLKGSAKTRLLDTLATQLQRPNILSESSIGCGKLIDSARPHLGVKLHVRD